MALKKIKWLLVGMGIIIISLANCQVTVPPPELDGAWRPGVTTLEIGANNRWFQVRAWYPATRDTEPKLLSSDRHSVAALGNIMGIPSFLMGGDDVSRSGINAPVAPGKFPVILFNHGLLSYERQNTTQFEQLASHGYIVLSLAHPGESMVVVRDNGEAVPFNEKGVAYRAFGKHINGMKEMVPGLNRDIDRVYQSRDFPQFSKSMTELSNNPVFSDMQPLFRTVRENNLSLLDELSAKKSQLPGWLLSACDTDRIGAYGHSFGSIMSGDLAMHDARIRAAFGLDAPQLNIDPNRYAPYKIPVCYVYADRLEYAGEVIRYNGINRPLLAKNGSCEALFLESAHYNFTDLNLVLPLRYTPMLGKSDNARLAENLEKLLLAFFDTHLKGKDTLRTLKPVDVELRVY